MNRKPTTDPKEIFLRNFRYRFYKALDYLTLFIYALVVAIGAFLADYILVLVIGFIVKPVAAEYPFVKQVFDWFQIGSAILALLAAFVLSFYSALSQMRFASQTAKEAILGDEEDESSSDSQG